MPRPKCCRRVGQVPAFNGFKPVGVPMSELEEVVLSMDEFEAIRLADLEGLYQEQAAEQMKVSRQTFGRIVETARRKVAQVLAEGLALRIEGGEVEIPEKRTLKCHHCQYAWEASYSTGRSQECPVCKATSIDCFEYQVHRKGRGNYQRRQCRGRKS